MSVEKLKRLVAFAVIMETGDGIRYKSPDYVAEKYDLAMKLPNPEEMLDTDNKAKYREWCIKWLGGTK